MPIQVIRSGNIFHTDRLNPWEEIRGPQIIFWTNTQWTNQDWKSVASQVALRYCHEFERIHNWVLRIWDVYSAQGFLAPVLPAEFHGIVCNEKWNGTKHDWTFWDLWVTEGLTQLASSRVNLPWAVATRTASFQDEVRDLLDGPNFGIQTLADIAKRAELEINPPHRIAFIGTWPSWTENHADWRWILQAMDNSTLNLVLYLWSKEIQDQVAQVVRAFPDLRTSAPLRDLEERIYC